MNISIVIPNYNGEELLQRNIPQVMRATQEYKKGNVEVIIVDDDSVDESLLVLESLQTKYYNLTVVTHKKNYGFSTAVNSGVTHASGDIVVLLNTDVVPDKGFLTILVDHFVDDKVFGVGFLDNSTENGKVVQRGRGIGRWQRGLLVHSKGEVNKTNTLWVNGGSGAFSRNTWNRLGGFYEVYNPFYWEDIDLSYRALKAGYNLQFDKKIIVTHEHEKGAIKSHYSSYVYRQIAYRNSLLFVWLNITSNKLLLSHLFWLPYHCVNTLIKEDTAFLVGLIKAFIHLPRIVRIRQKNIQQMLLSDSEILSRFHS